MDSVWIGLVEFDGVDERAREVLEDQAGGFAQVLCLARDAAHFADRVSEQLAEWGLRVVEIKDVSRFAERIGDAIPELMSLAAEALRSGEVEIGTVHLYPWE